MQVFHGSAAPWSPVDSKTFVGSARTRRLASSDAGTSVVVYHVAFDAGARTNWHTHSGAQWLLVVDGTIRVQKWGERPIDVAAGSAIVIDPDEKHWHGAAPSDRGAHLAVNVRSTTHWLEPVSDAEYRDGESG